jgi:hypothetical protein
MKKSTIMRRRNTLRVVMLAPILLAAFLILRSAAPAGKDKPRKESIDECCKHKPAGKTDKVIWENLSQQFFSSI